MCVKTKYSAHASSVFVACFSRVTFSADVVEFRTFLCSDNNGDITPHSDDAGDYDVISANNVTK